MGYSRVLPSDQFAAIKVNSDGKGIKSTLEKFDAEEEAIEFVVKNWDNSYIPINGLADDQLNKIMVYAGAAKEFISFIGGRRFTWSSEQHALFVIMHEIGHLEAGDQEFQADKFALEKLGW